MRKCLTCLVSNKLCDSRYMQVLGLFMARGVQSIMECGLGTRVSGRGQWCKCMWKIVRSWVK